MSTMPSTTPTNRARAAAVAPSLSAAGPEILRRLLVGLILALIIARPLVPGEDMGLVQALSGASGLFLTFGWLLVAIGWAGWRAWTGKAAWYGSWVEVGLCLVVVAVLASTLRASYPHPGWVSLGDWFALLVAFCLVRQLATGPGDNRRLAAALAAVAVALAGQAVYERAFAPPGPKPLGPVTAPKIADLLSQQGFFIGEDDAALQSRTEQVRNRSVSAAYQHPESLAGLLILALPFLVGWTLTAGERRPWAGPMWAGVALTALTVAGLWLTHAWAAMAALAAVGIVAIVLSYRVLLWRTRWWALGCLLFVGAIGFLSLRGAGGQKLLATANRFWLGRLDAWTPTWAMIRSHLFVGVGPGNFGRFYPQFMTNGPKLDLPHDLALELWSTCGLLALLGLIVACVGFFARAWQGREPVASEAEVETDKATGLRWEMYVGAMLGLCVGIFLWALDQPELDTSAFKAGGFVAAGRSLLWFLAFALLEGTVFSGRRLAWALTVGVAALLVALTVSDGISFPALAQPLWIAAALALNAWGARQPAWVSSARPRVLLPMPILAAICGCYVLGILAPVTSSWWQLRDVHAIAQFRRQSPKVREGYGWADRRTLDAMLAGLQKASDSDPGNVLPRLEYAAWAELALTQFQTRAQLAQKARTMIVDIQKLDPQNKGGYLAEAALYLIGARQPVADPRPYYRQAADALKRAVELDPTNPRLRSLLGDVTARSNRKPRVRNPVRLPPSVFPPLPGTRPAPERAKPRS